MLLQIFDLIFNIETDILERWMRPPLMQFDDDKLLIFLVIFQLEVSLGL